MRCPSVSKRSLETQVLPSSIELTSMLVMYQSFGLPVQTGSVTISRHGLAPYTPWQLFTHQLAPTHVLITGLGQHGFIVNAIQMEGHACTNL